MAAFLAGVAFAAIVLVVGPERRRGDDATSDIGISIFVAAFFCLTVAAFLYGTAAGEQVIASRVALLTLVAGIVLGIGVMDLFAGVVWLVEARGGRAVSDLVARLVSTTLPILSLYYLTYTITNVDRLSSHSARIGTRLDVRLLFAALVVLVVTLAGLQMRWNSWVVRSALGPAFARRVLVITAVTVASVVAAVVMAILTGGILQESPHFVVPSWIFDISAAVLLAANVLFACYIRVLADDSARSARRPIGI